MNQNASRKFSRSVRNVVKLDKAKSHRKPLTHRHPQSTSLALLFYRAVINRIEEQFESP